MRKPAPLRDRFELRDVPQRVQVIRLAQPLLAHVDQPELLEPPRERVDPAQPGGDRRVLADVRVDEQRAARREHAAGFGQHAAQRLRRQVFEHVERVRLGERAVGERQPAQIAEQQIHAGARFLGEERADVDADSRRPPVGVPQQRPAAAAAEIDDAIAGAGARKARSMSLRILDPSSGGETRSCRASACSASSRYLVCSANSTDGRRSRIVAAPAARYCAAAAAAGERAAVARRASAWQSGQRTSDEQLRPKSSADATRRSKSASSRSARRSQE